MRVNAASPGTPKIFPAHLQSSGRLHLHPRWPRFHEWPRVLPHYLRACDKDDNGWKGDAWIDIKAFQPVLVHTAMARNIPFAVRTLLGTSVPGLGFTVTYEPERAGSRDAIWFPVTFGTEFKLHVLFFLNRTIVLNVRNRDFEQTHVHSTILDSAPAS